MTTTLQEDLQALLTPTPGRVQPRPPRRGRAHAHSAGGQAELTDFDGSAGSLRVEGDTPVKDWREVLKIALPPGFDPDDYVIVGDPGVTSHTVLTPEGWENVQAWWKLKFAHKDEAAADTSDAEKDALQEALSDWSLPEQMLLTGDDFFIINAGDWQIGQQDAGGTAYTVQRLKRRLFPGIVRRVEALRRAGRPLGTAVLAGGGDMVEGCTGFYPMQEFTVDLDRRQQSKVVRRLLIELVKLLGSLGFTRIVMVATPGNHGENRKDGKAYTTFGDNDDVAAFEAVYDVISETPLAELCEWIIPEDDLTLTMEAAGRVLAWTHGHVATRGSSIDKKLWDWWTGQAMGRQPAGDADILNTFHYHHFRAVEQAGRAWLQGPAMCGDSAWWTSVSGQASSPGTLTYVVSEHSDRLFEDLDIIPG